MNKHIICWVLLLSGFSPKMAFGIIVLLLAVNIPIIIASIKTITTGTVYYVGFLLLGLIALVDFAILSAIIQLQTPSYTKISYY